MASESGNYSQSSRRPRPGALVAIVVLHGLAIYGLALVFAPGAVSSVQDAVLSSFTVTITTPPPPPPPPSEPQAKPDPGTAGAPGKKAVPKAVIAPKPPIVIKPKPAPQASATGSADTSGARDSGSGTGANGAGSGTGSGTGGAGQGGGMPATKPQWIAGQINNARDYPTPPGGQQARAGTQVIVEVTVGTDGRARGCRVFRPSPDAEADAITCRLVEQRLRFKPATDSAGNPVAASFYWRQRWF